ncbi:MAG: CorA family divalent cation transporter [Synechocystis sp.]
MSPRQALPINLVGSLFGMNVPGIPLEKDNHGFLIVVATMFSITSLLAYLAFGRKRDV